MTMPNLRLWFQFRLSFLLCLMGLMAAATAGYKFTVEVVWTPDPETYRGYNAVMFLIGPIASAGVLLLGREIVVIPMATGFLISAGIEGLFGITNFGIGNPVMLHIGFLLGATLGLVRLLSQEVTPVRLLLGFPVCFFLGAWLVPIFATFP